MPDTTKVYGRRKTDMQDIDELTPDVLANLTDSQKVHIKILQNQASISTVINDITSAMNMYNKLIITGEDGKPSMQERMRKVEEFIDNWKYWVRLIGGALIIQTITFFFATIIALIRFLPLLEKLSNQIP